MSDNYKVCVYVSFDGVDTYSVDTDGDVAGTRSSLGTIKVLEDGKFDACPITGLAPKSNTGLSETKEEAISRVFWGIFYHHSHGNPFDIIYE
jgi:hypothetical protein